MVRHGTAKDLNINDIFRDKSNTLANSNKYRPYSIMSKSSSSASSDLEPFYLHPPRNREIYGTSLLSNDGLYINPMRRSLSSSSSPNGSISGESFFLHDPQEVLYNRVKDLFESEGQIEPKFCNSSSAGLTVQADIHSSSSGAGSGTDEPPSLQSSIIGLPKHNTCNFKSSDHDYEDIYLLHEEVKHDNLIKSNVNTRSRSRDSGSHSRSASASSTRSNDYVVQYNQVRSYFRLKNITLTLFFCRTLIIQSLPN